MGNKHPQPSHTHDYIPITGLQQCPRSMHLPPSIALFVPPPEWDSTIAPRLDLAFALAPRGKDLARFFLYVLPVVVVVIVLPTVFAPKVARALPSLVIFLLTVPAGFYWLVREFKWSSAFREACGELNGALVPRGVNLFLQRGGHKGRLKWLGVAHPPVVYPGMTGQQPQAHMGAAPPPMTYAPGAPPPMGYAPGAPPPHQAVVIGSGSAPQLPAVEVGGAGAAAGVGGSGMSSEMAPAQQPGDALVYETVAK